MKLLFDNNLSHKLILRLEDIFPGSTHVMIEALDESDDQEIWEFARKHAFAIVTKDSDYSELCIIKGFPPKIVWLRIGNCRVGDIEHIIRNNAIVLNQFHNNPSVGIVEID